MVTYGDLFSFVIVITNIISLVLTFVIFIDNRRKKMSIKITVQLPQVDGYF